MTGECSISDCGKPPCNKSTDLCNTHYIRKQRHGDPNIVLYGNPKPPCAVEGCENISVIAYLKLCGTHYGRYRKYGSPVVGGREKRRIKGKCTINGCEKNEKSRGLCNTHYYRMDVYGSTDEPVRKPRVKKHPPGMICIIEECSRQAVHNYMCGTHYGKAKYHGDPHFSQWPPPEITCSERDCENRVYKVARCFNHHRAITIALRSAQQDRCAICNLHKNDAMKKQLSLDHDHVTNIIRGLLCHSCNVGLGNFKDSVIFLNSAITYLTKSSHSQGKESLLITICTIPGCNKRRRGTTGSYCGNHLNRIKKIMRSSQNDRCAICNIHASDAPRKKLLLDHDHSTGRIRGFLCHNCNVGIGQFKERKSIMHIAIRYLASSNDELVLLV